MAKSRSEIILPLIMALGIKHVSVATVTLSAMVMWIGFYAWRIIFNNYAVETFNASSLEVGLIQALREVPGLLAFGAGTLAVWLTESRITSLSIICAGLGLLICGASSSLAVLGIGTFLMSAGFHYFEPNNQAQLLNLVKADKVGRAQGRVLSFESMAGLAGAGLVMGLTLFISYQGIYYLIGGAVAVPIQQRLPAGVHQITWNGLDAKGQPAASGVYFYQIMSGSKTEAKKMIFLK